MSKYKQTFLQGTLILLAAGMINRLLGFVPRITLPRIIGSEGVGLFQMGYPLMGVVLTITTGGIPLAVSKLVAEAASEGNEKRVRGILQVALAVTAGLSLLFSAACALAAPWMTSRLFTDDRIFWSFLAMTPIIPLAGVSAVFRGYFQGRHNMIPTAVSQIVETMIRIVTMLAFAYALLPRGIEYAAAGAMIGVLVGELGGLLVLLLQLRANRPRQPVYGTARIGQSRLSGRMNAIKRIFRISIPVTGSRLVGSSSYFLESILIIHGLAAAGIATSVATSQYGALQGMIIPIVYLPSALTYSLAVSLIPSLSEAAARKDQATIHKRLHQSLRLALVSGAPFAVLMFVLADPICYFLYKQADIGIMLKMIAPIALFLYFKVPLEAALQALNRPGTALLNTFIGAVVKLALLSLLVSNPSFGILGAVMAFCVTTAVVTLLDWSSISRLLKFSLPGGDLLKIFAAMLVMGGSCRLVMDATWIAQPFHRFLLSCLLGIGIYLVSIVLLKVVDRDDFKKLPWLSRRL
ncbi:stage V sporulation protein B [Paenibacillus sp. J31TS4]|uniref:stage V sporulation protein B n=1 Tax=Paenibacillus sp. J31TS4 TaxID=2807195 RepID=UPI001BCC1CE2|nr:stage V sporulation protein B [Paenibacillus sp. J31TS4]